MVASESVEATALPTEFLLVIEPKRGWQWFNLREIRRYRELLYFLVWRDIKVRYKQTLLGPSWELLRRGCG